MQPTTITPTSRPDLGAKADADVRKELSFLTVMQARRHMPNEGFPKISTREDERFLFCRYWVDRGVRAVFKDGKISHYEKPVTLIERSPESRAEYRSKLSPFDRAICIQMDLNSQIASDAQRRKEFVEL